MNKEQRRARIAELERELAELRKQESEDLGYDHEALLSECRVLKRDRKAIEATKLYRAKVGCGLREAHYAIEAL
jgi:ribosomal protein L7/L12